MKKYMMFLFAILGSMLVFCGCSDTESNHPMLKKAGQSIRMGEYRNAEICYKKYLAKNPAAVSVHYALANLYDEHLEDYLLAVYHYKEFLRLQNDASAETVRNVENFIKRCEQKYVQKGKTVKKVFLTDEQEIERMAAAYKKNLAEQQKKAAAELARLKKEADEAKKAELNTQKTSAPKTEVKAEKKAEVQTIEKIEVKTAEKTAEKTAVETAGTEEKNKPAVVQAEDKKEKTTAEAEAQKTENKPAEDVKKESAAVTEKTAVVQKKTEEKTAAEQKTEVIKDFSKLPSMPQEKTAPAVEKTVEKKEEIKEYKVKSGDTFSHLSRKFYGSVRYYKLLMKYNNISNPNALRVGKTIKVPPLDVLKGEKNEK